MHESDEGAADLGFLEREIVLVDSQEPRKLVSSRLYDNGSWTGILSPSKTAKPKHPLRKTYSHVIYAVPTFSNPSGKTMPLHAANASFR